MPDDVAEHLLALSATNDTSVSQHVKGLMVVGQAREVMVVVQVMEENIP